MIAIYKITNPENGVYIGQTSSYNRRMKEYKRMMCKDQPKIYESLLKYGSNNHSFEILHELPDDSTIKVRDTYEQVYIDFHKDAGFGILNIRDAGLNGSHSNETKTKMSLAGKAAMTPERIEKLSKITKGNKYWLGRKHKPETIEKMKKHGGSMRVLYGKFGALHPFAKKVVNITNGDVYDCVKDAADSCGMKYKSFQKRLSGYWVNNTNYKYL